MTQHDIGAIILAAGSARRMGADKLLLPIGGRPMIAHVLSLVRAAALADPIVVTRPEDARLNMLLVREGIAPLASPDHALGMGHSIAAAVSAVPGHWRGAFVLLGDMPFVSPALLRAMAAQLTASAIIVPVRGGRRGNPVLWARAHFDALGCLTGDGGGRTLWAARDADIVEQAWDDDTIFVDIDTPSDLARSGGGGAA